MVETGYDDGGISGGSLDRPSLLRLMEDVDDGKVDQIVVYKIDRLTRSLTDFAKLVERLDKAGASFVSVTQSFNTSTSMGRLTLNVLLSFAQFEREVTAERIRDKIAASKKKGLWMGGSLPLGYEKDGRTLKIHDQQAQTIRTLFDLYLEHRNLVKVAQIANRMKLKPKGQISNEIICGKELASSCDHDNETFNRQTDEYQQHFDRSGVHYILTNPVYAGRIRHKNEIFVGQHQAIIEPATFDLVQQQLMELARKTRGKAANGTKLAPLIGKLFDETGDRLTPSHTTSRHGRRYYYVSSRLVRPNCIKVQKQANHQARLQEGWRLPATPLENQLANSVHDHLRKSKAGDLIKASTSASSLTIRQALNRLSNLDDGQRKEALLAMIGKVTFGPGKAVVHLNIESLASAIGIPASAITDQVTTFSINFTLRKRGVETKILINPDSQTSTDATLVTNIAKARHYYLEIKKGKTFEDIALAEGTSKRRIQHIASYAFLSPLQIKRIVEGKQPVNLTSQWLKENALPTSWQEQETIFRAL